jgi:hypothetical protein
MSHDEPNAMRLQPGGSGEIIRKFGTSDRIEFACLVPGHYEAGMRGRVVVRETSAVSGGEVWSASSRTTRWAKRTRWSRL